jgi:hypothetical protein
VTAVAQRRAAATRLSNTATVGGVVVNTPAPGSSSGTVWEKK